MSSSWMNSPIPSLLLPLWQNECETTGMKICHLYSHSHVIFIGNVLVTKTYGTTQNQPKLAKTTHSQPKPPKTTQNHANPAKMTQIHAQYTLSRPVCAILA